MKTERKVIKVILFFAISVFLLVLVQKPFRERDERIYDAYEEFYQERENSLDAVYIGSSTTYAFWQPIAAWENTGFAVYPITSPSMPPQSIKYLIAEARKTQKYPLFIINLNTFNPTNTSTVTISDIHKVADYMPLSGNKVSMINELAAWADVQGLDRMEFFMPIIRYHDDWQGLKAWNFFGCSSNKKGTYDYKNHYKNVKDVTGQYAFVYDSQPMTEDQNKVLTDLLQYLKEESVNALFVVSPGGYATDTKVLEMYNDMVNAVESEGFPALNLINRKDEIGLDTTSDFFDAKHTNIHGALKFTGYLSDYLKENYDFKDKRGREEYSSWDEAVEPRTNVLKSYVLDFEQDLSRRDNTLPAMELRLKKLEKSVYMRWDPVDGADAYHIYRKDAEHNDWELLTDLAADADRYTDEGLKAGAAYTYTIVGSRNVAGTDYYGNCIYAGKSAKMP